MNISHEKTDDLNAVLTVSVAKEDYETKMEEVLKDLRKKANLPGFRPGKVPQGLIRKMYGKSVMLEEVNKLVSESISKYIYENELNILGDPLPNESQNNAIDWENQTDFEFKFDLGLAPEIDLALTKKDKILYYDIQVDDTAIDSTVESHVYQHGESIEVELVENEDMIIGDIVQVDENKKPLEDGIKNSEVTISLKIAKEEKEKEKFLGKKIGETVIFNPAVMYPNSTELANILNIDKEETETITGEFEFIINQIKRFIPAEINQELFDKIYGKDVVSSEDDFREKIKEGIKERYTRESDYKFLLDSKESLINMAKIEIPDEFLKRWLLATNKDEDLNSEKLEQDYPLFKKDMLWMLIKNHLLKQNEIKAEEEEIKEYASQIARSQFYQYGYYNAEPEIIENTAKRYLEQPEEKQKILDFVLEEKLRNYLKETVKLDLKKISADDFTKMLQETK